MCSYVFKKAKRVAGEPFDAEEDMHNVEVTLMDYEDDDEEGEGSEGDESEGEDESEGDESEGEDESDGEDKDEGDESECTSSENE